jgi:tight adherence protein C
MEQIVALLNQAVASPDALRWVFIGVVSLGVALLSLALMHGLSAALDPMRKRLELVAPKTPAPIQAGQGSRLTDILQPISPLAMPKQEKERTSMRQRLGWAGLRNPNAIALFYSSKLILALLLPLVVLAFALLKQGISTSTLLYAIFGAAALGNLLPSLYLDHVLKKRQTQLRRAFPDALDLLVVCVEAGLGLKSAIARVADELGVSHPELAAEFSLLTSELRAGIETSEALENLAKRNGLDDIRGFAALLSQSMRFGTSVSDTLRVYASEFREKRMQRAEEQAGKLSVKMIFPMVVCIFPSFFVVAIGPAVLSAMRSFGN